MVDERTLCLSGDYLSLEYRLSAEGEAQAGRLARQICIEQSVEFPEELICDEAISSEIVGRILSLHRVDEGIWSTLIEFAVECTGYELPQLLNLAFGNISLLPGVKLWRMHLPESLLEVFSGPRFGASGWRSLVEVEEERPLLCTALKPLGLSPERLARQAHQLALGGIDLIKDDHGLADQPFCPFAERVEACARAIREANQSTGGKAIYLANITGPVDTVFERARLAKRMGAGGLLLSPGLVGWEVLRILAAEDELALPLMVHPALLGSYLLDPRQGISMAVLLGQIARLCGGDAVIFPHPGGRFAFSEEDCLDLLEGTRLEMGELRSISPVPAGGMTLERVPEMRRFYGEECILLIGGDLHRDPEGLISRCRHFRSLLERGPTRPTHSAVK